jgi:hypothetical protein
MNTIDSCSGYVECVEFVDCVECVECVEINYFTLKYIVANKEYTCNVKNH